MCDVLEFDRLISSYLSWIVELVEQVQLHCLHLAVVDEGVGAVDGLVWIEWVLVGKGKGLVNSFLIFLIPRFLVLLSCSIVLDSKTTFKETIFKS